ncbi:universal stress protein [Streptomyces malaysiense]|uniref:Stress-inducible protein n=1 Tax=Streptomyces malaysiense TaxID=1428626 RepID=A0A1J4Q1Q5_9ACTN|nr:universal stress protein [Streptomyces malaysiense]OIK26087.1 stress-inducible protein [Streptomyces malaysiense]
MSRTVTVGLDGSPESRTAAEWAAGEARLRGLPLRLVHVWEPATDSMAQDPVIGAATRRHWTERIPRETAGELRQRHPGLEVLSEHRDGFPGELLAAAAEESELLVLGSRGLGRVGGYLVGSVGFSVVARAGRPVVLVRSGWKPDGDAAQGPVVLGVDTTAPDDTVFAFAFEEAERRGTSVRAVRTWSMPPYYVYGFAADPTFDQEWSLQEKAALTEVLKPWRQKYPDVEVTEECGYGSAALRLVEASQGAALVVVGRRRRPASFGAHIGPVAHAVLHHATAPVAVVPHG